MLRDRATSSSDIPPTWISRSSRVFPFTGCGVSASVCSVAVTCNSPLESRWNVTSIGNPAGFPGGTPIGPDAISVLSAGS